MGAQRSSHLPGCLRMARISLQHTALTNFHARGTAFWLGPTASSPCKASGAHFNNLEQCSCSHSKCHHKMALFDPVRSPSKLAIPSKIECYYFL
eukprot:1161244-Pelagomonas_calceolata.AAC.3